MPGLFLMGRFRSGIIAVAVTAAMLCHTAAFGADVTPLEKEAYGAAMLAAMANGTQAEVNRGLLAVVAGKDETNRKRLHNDTIKWEGEPGASRVMVACFMSRDTYDQYYKANLDAHLPTYALTKSLWVTVVPQLKNYFIGKICPPTRGRIVAALGLNPARDYQVILEMWVDPTALFRPAPDPEATDHEATVSTRTGVGTWAFANDTNPFLQFNDEATFVDHQGGTPYTFRQWFAWNASQCYQMPDPNDVSTWGTPWTRLGYTYDWGKIESHVGLSEFILRIDPTVNGGQLTVTLVKAVDCSTRAWDNYFKCEASTLSEEDAPAAETP